MDKLKFYDLLRNLLNSEDLEELKSVLSNINEFIIQNKISSNSEEYQKFKSGLNLMKTKINRRNRKNKLRTENFNFIITEDQLFRLYNNLINEQSSSGTSSPSSEEKIEKELTPEQIKSLEKSLPSDCSSFKDSGLEGPFNYKGDNYYTKKSTDNKTKDFWCKKS